MNRALAKIVAMALSGEISEDDVRQLDSWFKSHGDSPLEDLVSRCISLFTSNPPVVETNPDPENHPLHESTSFPKTVGSKQKGPPPELNSISMAEIHRTLIQRLEMSTGLNLFELLPHPRESKARWYKRATRLVPADSLRKEIRSLAKEVKRRQPEKTSRQRFVARNPGRFEADSYTVFQILQLFNEAKLSVRDASSLLVPDLVTTGYISEQEAQPRTKEGLDRWVRRLLRHVPASTMLHETVRIRNAVMHSPNSSWPFRERDHA